MWVSLVPVVCCHWRGRSGCPSGRRGGPGLRRRVERRLDLLVDESDGWCRGRCGSPVGSGWGMRGAEEVEMGVSAVSAVSDAEGSGAPGLRWLRGFREFRGWCSPGSGMRGCGPVSHWSVRSRRGPRVASVPGPGPSRLRVEVDGVTLVDLDQPVEAVSVTPGVAGGAEVEVRPVSVVQASPLRVVGRRATVSGADFRYRADSAVSGPVRTRTWTVREGGRALRCRVEPPGVFFSPPPPLPAPFPQAPPLSTPGELVAAGRRARSSPRPRSGASPASAKATRGWTRPSGIRRCGRGRALCASVSPASSPRRCGTGRGVDGCWRGSCGRRRWCATRARVVREIRAERVRGGHPGPLPDEDDGHPGPQTRARCCRREPPAPARRVRRERHASRRAAAVSSRGTIGRPACSCTARLDSPSATTNTTSQPSRGRCARSTSWSLRPRSGRWR